MDRSLIAVVHRNNKEDLKIKDLLDEEVHDLENATPRDAEMLTDGDIVASRVEHDNY